MSNYLKPTTSTRSLDTSQVTLTDFYMSRSQCDASKLKKTYNNWFLPLNYNFYF